MDQSHKFALKNLDLIITIVVVALNIVWVRILDAGLVAGIFLALPLILFLPGYTLTQTLFYQREAPDLEVHNPMQQAHQRTGYTPGKIDLIVLSLGLSMAIDVLVGFGLNIFPSGVQRSSWVLSLGLFSIFFAIVAMLLRQKDIAASTRPVYVLKPIYTRAFIRAAIFFVLAVLMGISACWLALIRPMSPEPSFTQFWILPTNQADKTCAISVGVRNFEKTSESYRVVIVVNQVQTHSWSPIILPPQQTWLQPVILAPVSVRTLSIEAKLYKSRQPDTVYRNVYATFLVSSIHRNKPPQKLCTLRT